MSRQRTTPAYAKPACFESFEQWAEWQKWALHAGTGHALYCVDCLPAFHDQMCDKGRCAYPNTTFVEFGGAIIGRRRGPKEEGLP